MASRPELYNLDCVAYESVMLGLFSVWRGESGDREKINEVAIGFSRDGFHWDRANRQSFLPVSDAAGSWNWANVQSAGGGCLIVGDELYFYVSGRQGRPGSNAPGVCTTGLATLRRDGFASMDFMPDRAPVMRAAETGTLTTRVITFAGEHLFVNADVSRGQLRAEILDESGQVIAPYSRDACVPVTANGTRQRITWQHAPSLAVVRNRKVRLRLTMTYGQIFSFWVSADTAGHSGGYVAAGGPEFAGPIDRGAQ